MAKKKKVAAKKQTLPVWVWFVLAAVIIAVGAFAWASGGPETSSDTLPRSVSVARAAELRSSGAYMLDVREVSEWNEFHMPDATLIPLGQLAQRVNEVPKDREIVVVCRSGNRSQEGRDILLQAGFTNVTSMDGGMVDWRAQGLPVVTGP